MGLRWAIPAWGGGVSPISFGLHRPRPGLPGKWRRHRLESRSRRGPVGLIRFRPGEILGGGGTPYWPGIRGVLGKEEEGAKSLIQTAFTEGQFVGHYYS